MSRSNPTESSNHPCTRWHEYDGANGNVRYYDRDTKQNVPVPDGFRFILLDELAVIKGWHDASESGITSNEVKRIDRDPLTVKAFKGGVLAEGFYSKIRDRIVNLGGHYTANLYIAFKPSADQPLSIGSLQLKGAALGAWMEFAKKNRSEIYKKSIVIRGSKEGKKGKVVFQTPVFHLGEISPETDAQAMGLDKTLQEYLKGYFDKSKITPAPEDADAPSRGDEPEDPRDYSEGTPDDDSDLPF